MSFKKKSLPHVESNSIQKKASFDTLTENWSKQRWINMSLNVELSQD